MINVIGSNPPPAQPLPPDLPGEESEGESTQPQVNSGDAPPIKEPNLAVVEDQAPPPTPPAPEAPENKTESAQGDAPPPKPRRKIPGKQIIAGVVLLLLVIGSGVGLYLMKLSQDLRQQASEGAYTISPTPIQLPTPTEEPRGGCSGSSAAQCQGKSPGDRCGNNAPYGICDGLDNQADENGVPCSCNRSGGGPQPTTDPQTPTNPTPTEEPTPTPTEEPTPTPTDEPDEETTPTPTDEPDDNNDDDDDDSETIADSSSDTDSTSQELTLPSELPQSGPEDWLQYLQIGLGTLGVGALLLLFL